MSLLVRCYVPASRAVLEGLAAGQALPAGAAAFAVTPGLLGAIGSPGATVDDEEAEYAATMLAADRSVRLLDAGDAGDRRRVVVAVDAAVTAGDSSGDSSGDSAGDAAVPGEVLLALPVPWSRVASFHVDDVAAHPLVEAAVRALAEGRDAGAALAELAEEDLAWYAASELEVLLDQPGPPG